MTAQKHEFETCPEHSGIVEATKTLKVHIDKLDRRMWTVLVTALFQLCGIGVILLQMVYARGK